MLHWRCAGQLNLKLKLGILSFFSADQNNHKPAYHRYLFELPIIKNVLHLRKSGYMEKAPRDRQQNYQHLWLGVPVNPADQKAPVKAAYNYRTASKGSNPSNLITYCCTAEDTYCPTPPNRGCILLLNCLCL